MVLGFKERPESPLMEGGRSCGAAFGHGGTLAR